MAYSAPANVATGHPQRVADVNAGAYFAYQILHVAFVIVPLVAGIDKFYDYLCQWDKYLAPIVSNTLHMAPHSFMMAVGVVEIVAALIVAFWPKVGGYIVAIWLAGITVNLALNPVHYWDVAARDLGLLLAALALGSLSLWASRVRHAMGT